MQTKTIFITATNTDVGKTYATCKLIQEFAKRGFRVGVFKPIETGVIDKPLDGTLLLEYAQRVNPALKMLTCKDIVPFQFSLAAAPFVAKAQDSIDKKLLKTSFEKIAKHCDIVLIEGAGGLMVPIDEDFYMYHLIKEFDAKTLLVTHANLGCIHDTLLNLQFLQSLHVAHEWCVNFKDNEEKFMSETMPFYASHFDTVFTLQYDLEKIVNKLLI
ncbi:MAG: dethiobiotin synthase [Sulfurospirillum sp.]|nr:dethiobiotin synthase [Sulfurospirillum sp.]